MDHKRGYNFVEDHNSCVSPTDSPSRPKRLKDLSHQHEYPYHLDHSRPSQQATSCASAPKKSHHALHNLRWQSHVALDRAEMETATRLRSAPQQTELEKKMEDRAYSNLLPMVKKELAQWTFCNNSRGTKRPSSTDSSGAAQQHLNPDDETTCAVCHKRRFKGWDALLIHAQKFSKEMPWQHRGYFRALQEALNDKRNEDSVVQQHPPAHDHTVQTTTHVKQKLNVEKQTNTDVGPKLADWRPDILIVKNKDFSKVEKVLKEQQQGRILKPDTGSCAEPRLKVILAVYTNEESDSDENEVVMIPASKVGYVDGREISSLCLGGNAGKGKLLVQAEEKKLVGNDPPCSPKEEPAPSSRCESLKETRGLRLTLDVENYEEPHTGKLFDPERFTNRTTKIMSKWTNNFKAASREVLVQQRVFRNSSKDVEMDARFREDLRRIQTYTPSCKKKIKEEMGLIEDHLRDKRLLWLQELESIRDQFEELAHNLQQEEERECLWDARAEVTNAKALKEENEKATQVLQAKAIVALARRRSQPKQQAERAEFMDLVMEDAKFFKFTSIKAREERERLQGIHHKVHQKAQASRKECPVCLESFRIQPKVEVDDANDDDDTD